MNQPANPDHGSQVPTPNVPADADETPIEPTTGATPPPIGLEKGVGDNAGIPQQSPGDTKADGSGARMLTLKLWRGDSSGGKLVTYSVPVEDGMVVLDAVFRVQETQAPDLAVRWNCKAGKCGSCSAEINGKPQLMCMTRLDTLPEGEVTVNPMRTFPLIRDLVTDVSYNFEKAREMPAFTPIPKPEGGYRMMQQDVERGQEFRKCIECFMCQNVCHVIRDHDDNKKAFAGPRFLMRHAELDMHPLNTVDQRERSRAVSGLGYCNITKCCTDVCPEHIHITDNAIIPLKERLVDRKYDPLVWLGNKILRRKHDEKAPADRN